jgi:ABC-type antimicrobial peptide transport system permease subunit
MCEDNLDYELFKMIKMSLTKRAFRNVWRKKTRTLLVVIALGFSVAAIISVYSGVEASTDNVQDMIEGYEEYLVETGELTDYQEKMIQVTTNRFGGGRPFGGPSQASNISAEAIEKITNIEYVEEVIPLIESPVGEVDFETMREEMRALRDSGEFNPGEGGFQEMQDLRMSYYDYIIMGVPLNSSLDESYLILPENIVEGSKITKNNQSMVMIREDLTFSDAFFEGSEVGDTKSIEGYDFAIAGIYKSDTNRNYVYMDISDARKVIGLEEGCAYTLNVYVDDKSAIDLVVYDISEMFSEYSVTAYSDIYSLFSERIESGREAEISSLQNEKSGIENQGYTIIFGLIIAVALIVLFLMMYTVKERTKEIGLMKAIGFTGKSVMSQFILEGTIIGFVGGITGIIIGYIAGPAISNALLPNSEVLASSNPTFSLILLVICLTIFLGVAGTIYPAFQASRKSPMEAMRNE